MGKSVDLTSFMLFLIHLNDNTASQLDAKENNAKLFRKNIFDKH